MADVRAGSMRGPRGHDGPTGPTGPAGPPAPTKISAVTCEADGSSILIAEQTGEFADAVRNGVGNYQIDLLAILGLSSSAQLIPMGTAVTTGHIVTINPGFTAGHGFLTVRVVDAAGSPVDDAFFVHVVLVGT